VVPEGRYCLHSFALPMTGYSFCQGPSINVKKGIINNAGQWRFATERAFTHPGRTRFGMMRAQQNGPAVFQMAVNHHPDLFEN